MRPSPSVAPWFRAAIALTLLASVLSAVTAAVAPAPAIAASYQDWPMFLQNPERTAARPN